jgi:hypothetical protein
MLWSRKVMPLHKLIIIDTEEDPIPFDPPAIIFRPSTFLSKLTLPSKHKLGNCMFK